MSSAILVYHVAIGTIALLSGMLALSSKKGSRLHRISGRLFVGAMFTSAAVGTYLAFLKPELVTVVSGTLTCYLILTSWASIAIKKWCNLVYAASIPIAVIIGTTAFLGGIEAQNASEGLKDGFQAAPYFVFGGLGFFAGVLDLKCLMRARLLRLQILIRHIWRMCMAMLIATSALLLGQMQVFPTAIRSESILSIPLLIIILVMTYYINRTRLVQHRK